MLKLVPNKPWLTFFTVWLLLNVTSNADYPASTGSWTWLLPSPEATVTVLGISLWANSGRKVHRVARTCLVALFMLISAYQLIDSCYHSYFSRSFHAAMDAPLLLDVVKLMAMTEGVLATVAQSTLALLLAAGLAWLLSWNLKRLEHAAGQLSMPWSHASAGRLWDFGAFLLLLGILAWPLKSKPLTQSFAARLVEETQFLLNYPTLKRALHERFSTAQAAVSANFTNLDALEGRDLTLIVVESYGQGALDSTAHAKRVEEALAQLELQLTARQRHLASASLLPPSYGGGSWYAHATFSTGIKVWNPVEYNLLMASSAKPLSRYLRDAGYHTVHVMPATTSVWPQERFYDFHETYYAKDFAYQGPWLSWGRFPDQYVLDQVRRRVATVKGRPTFKELKLVSSHVPWRSVPSKIENWADIGDGSIYHQVPTQRFNVKWSNLKQAHWPYLSSILYDLDVVGDYVQRYEPADSLVIILGDHQPVKEASLSDNWAVPIHVSGPPDLIDRFVSQGFKPGLRPSFESSIPMQDLLPLLLRAFSSAPLEHD